MDTIKVKSVDIDIYRHTNNIEYAKFVMATFQTVELDAINIIDFEIHYVSETKENDELKIYKKLINNAYIFVIKKDDNIVCKAKLDFIKK